MIKMIKDSQFYTSLDMILESMKYLQYSIIRENNKKEILDTNPDYLVNNKTALDELNYIVKGLQNTKERGFELVKQTKSEDNLESSEPEIILD